MGDLDQPIDNIEYLPVFYSPIDLGEIFVDVLENKWYRVETKYINTYKYILDIIYEQEESNGDEGPRAA